MWLTSLILPNQQTDTERQRKGDLGSNKGSTLRTTAQISPTPPLSEMTYGYARTEPTKSERPCDS